jgi:dipeptidase E
MVGPGVGHWRFISCTSENPMVDLGWKCVGVLELNALPSIDEQRWAPLVQQIDVLLVAGGDAIYLCHWMRQSGLADLLASLDGAVWVGLSAGSMVMTPRIGREFVQWTPPSGDDSTLGMVDFSICPHLAAEGRPGNSMAAPTPCTPWCGRTASGRCASRDTTVPAAARSASPIGASRVRPSSSTPSASVISASGR